MADRFIAVHALFALMGLAVLLINSQRGITAVLSRVAAGVFMVAYIMYETIIITASSGLVRSVQACRLMSNP